MANLQSQITEIRRRIAEPYPDDQSDANITDDEIVDWIWQAELQLYYEASNNALSMAGSGAVASTSLTGTTPSFDLPTSPAMLRPVAVSMRNSSGGALKPCKIVPYDEYLWAKSNPAWRTGLGNPIASFYAAQVHVFPDKPSAGAVFLHYIVHPQRRYRRFRGSVTSKTSNTVWVDTKLISAGYPNDYFNTSGLLACKLKYVSGEPNGRVVDIADYVGSTGTVTTGTTTWPDSNDANIPDVNVGDQYEIGQVSVLPDIFDNAIYAYVAYLCFCKEDEDRSQKYFQEYQRQVGVINNAFNVGGNPR